MHGFCWWVSFWDSLFSGKLRGGNGGWNPREFTFPFFIESQPEPVPVDGAISGPSQRPGFGLWRHVLDPVPPSATWKTPGSWGREIPARWWFQRFFIFTRTWGRFPFWLIFFSNGWNHQKFTPWKMNGWFTYKKSPMKRKESMIEKPNLHEDMCKMLIFRGVNG